MLIFHSMPTKFHNLIKRIFLGGACRVCGDVTHLKKDCPQYQAQQEKQENNFRLQTLTDSNPEILDGSEDISRTLSLVKKQNNIIKFV